MFHDISPAVLERMHTLEAMDALDRSDGTPRSQRLLQIPPETGRFLALLVAEAPSGELVEIGTSGGYSTLWLAQAARARGQHITTLEISEEKVRLALETFKLAKVDNLVKLVQGDARQHLPDYCGIAFAFLDVYKEFYLECYELVVPCLVPGGLLVADNVISHRDELRGFVRRAESDDRVDGLVVPIGSGVLVCRKI